MWSEPSIFRIKMKISQKNMSFQLIFVFTKKNVSLDNNFYIFFLFLPFTQTNDIQKFDTKLTNENPGLQNLTTIQNLTNQVTYYLANPGQHVGPSLIWYEKIIFPLIFQQ